MHLVVALARGGGGAGGEVVALAVKLPLKGIRKDWPGEARDFRNSM